MNTSKERLTTLNSILLIVLKEIRLERGLSQALLGDAISKQPSMWSKIESGKSPLSLSDFFKVCSYTGINVNPSLVIQVAENYQRVFSMSGVYISRQELEDSADLVISKATDFYKKPEYINRTNSILNSPYSYINNSGRTVEYYPEVFNYILEINHSNQNVGLPY